MPGLAWLAAMGPAGRARLRLEEALYFAVATSVAGAALVGLALAVGPQNGTEPPAVLRDEPGGLPGGTQEADVLFALLAIDEEPPRVGPSRPGRCGKPGTGRTLVPCPK